MPGTANGATPTDEQELILAAAGRSTIFFFLCRVNAGRYLRGVPGADLGLSRDELSARGDWRRQRRDAGGTDAGHHHQADRRRGQQRSRAGDRALAPPAAARRRSASSSIGMWICSSTLQLTDAALRQGCSSRCPRRRRSPPTVSPSLPFPFWATRLDDRGRYGVADARCGRSRRTT